MLILLVIIPKNVTHWHAKWMNLTKVYDQLQQLGAEKVKALINFHCSEVCGKVQSSFLKNDVFEVFQLVYGHTNTKIMPSLEVFAAKLYS